MEQKIAEAEAMRDQLRAEALEKAKENPESVSTELSLDPTKSTMVFADLYSISSIKGVGGKLTAQLLDLNTNSIITARVDDTLPSGHIVKKITKDSLFVVDNDTESSLTLIPQKKTSEQAIGTDDTQETEK